MRESFFFLAVKLFGFKYVYIFTGYTVIFQNYKITPSHPKSQMVHTLGFVIGVGHLTPYGGKGGIYLKVKVKLENSSIDEHNFVAQKGRYLKALC